MVKLHYVLQLFVLLKIAPLVLGDSHATVQQEPWGIADPLYSGRLTRTLLRCLFRHIGKNNYVLDMLLIIVMLLK